MLRGVTVVAAGCAWTACFFAPERPADTTVGGLRAGTLALGRKHACTIDDAGELWCWGDNTFSQLGVSPLDVPFTGIPMRVGTGPWTSVVAGTEHTCALRAGEVSCWGANYSGQSSMGPESIALPSKINTSAPGPIVRLDAGGAASCAFDEAGSMYCWGRIDATADPIKPALVSPGGIAADWAQVGIAADHACARTKAGFVRCWGQNGILQLGLADENADTPLADAVAVSQPFDDLAIGPNASCGITREDRLYCWGDQVITQTPNPTTGNMLDARAWAGISIGDRHACAVTTGGEVHCWGDDTSGALGRKTLEPAASDRMFGIAAMESAEVAIAGDSFSCARSKAGVLSCWGANVYGELGNGEVATVREPFMVSVGATQLALGDTHTCAVDATEHVRCWGSNYEGQLGTPASEPVSAPSQPLAANYSAVAAGTSHSCGRSVDGTSMTCWGVAAEQRALDAGNMASAGTIVSASQWSDVVASGNTTCGNTDNGVIKCWGALGGMTPVATAQELYLGSRSGVYVQSEANAFSYYAWGSECFSATSDTQLTAAKKVRSVPSSTTVEDVALGADHVCAIENGKLMCWGRAEFGEAGPPVETCATPREVAHPLNRLWRKVSAAHHHTCAIDVSDQLYCWGENDYFELGNLIDGATATPMLAVASRTWNSVVTGVSHTCAITGAGETYCWGLNRYGEVGNGKTFKASPVPVALP